MNDFLLETRLKNEAPDLHRRVADSVLALETMLDSFRTWFPDFTDHTILHSLDVLEFCNMLLGEQASLLSIPECYALVMACYLHDIGMGVSRENFESFTAEIDFEGYKNKFPDADEAQIIRDYHNEFSGLFIQKYAELFDIPSDEMRFAIIQISRGHRKTDLYDGKEYPDLQTKDGRIRTAYLSAIMRLADEIDVGAGRNSELLFDTSKLTRQRDIDAFGTHESIREVEVAKEEIILHARLKEPRFRALVEALAGKIQETLDYCRDVAEKRSDLRITQKRIVVDYETAVILEGRIDSSNAPDVERKLMEAVGGRNSEKIIIDAEKLEYIASAGLRVLMKIRKQSGCPLEIRNVSNEVYDIFETTGFTGLFAVKKAYRRINVDGLEVIGRGFFGTVYRIDAETIVKVYRGEDSIPMIENEKQMARKAFLSGIPTAISYDIVRVGESYGSVFELLNAKSLHELVQDGELPLEDAIELYTRLLKQVHGTRFEHGELPSFRERFLGYLGAIEGCLWEGQARRLGKLLADMPEEGTVVHGDIQMKNIMMVDKEPMLIDMDTLGLGNPVFEFAGLHAAYQSFKEDDPGNSMEFFGMPDETIDEIWNRLVDAYFGFKDGEERKKTLDRIALAAAIRFLFLIETTDLKQTELGKIRIAHTAEHIEELLETVTQLSV